MGCWGLGWVLCSPPNPFWIKPDLNMQTWGSAGGARGMYVFVSSPGLSIARSNGEEREAIY